MLSHSSCTLAICKICGSKSSILANIDFTKFIIIHNGKRKISSNEGMLVKLKAVIYPSEVWEIHVKGSVKVS